MQYSFPTSVTSVDWIYKMQKIIDCNWTANWDFTHNRGFFDLQQQWCILKLDSPAIPSLTFFRQFCFSTLSVKAIHLNKLICSLSWLIFVLLHSNQAHVMCVLEHIFIIHNYSSYQVNLSQYVQKPTWETVVVYFVVQQHYSKEVQIQ